MPITPKQRALMMSEGGLSHGVIAGILGIDLADVERLMVEADPSVELLAPAYHVFHVEGLAIPEGTDWSGETVHVVGAFSTPQGSQVWASLSMERTEVFEPTGATIRLAIMDANGNIVDDLPFTGGGGGNPLAFNLNDPFSAGLGMDWRVVFITYSDLGNTPGPLPLGAGVTIVRARVACLVL